MRTHPLTNRVLTAHGDLWQLHGRLRAGTGGGATEIPGARLMASGIAAPQWNNADVTDAGVVDVESLRAWYAERDVPWGVRVPEGQSWPYGRHLFRKRFMVLRPERFRPADRPEHVEIRRATLGDLPVYAGLDATVFEEDDPGPTTEWTRPMLADPRFLLLLAVIDGQPVGVGYGARSSGPGGESVGVGGIGVATEWRRRGIGAALASHAVGWGLDVGADLAWLNPDTEDAARVYARMGFEECGAFEVYVEN